MQALVVVGRDDLARLVDAAQAAGLSAPPVIPVADLLERVPVYGRAVARAQLERAAAQAGIA